MYLQIFQLLTRISGKMNMSVQRKSSDMFSEAARKKKSPCSKNEWLVFEKQDKFYTRYFTSLLLLPPIKPQAPKPPNPF